MAKLQNVRESLDAIVGMVDVRNLGEAELVAVSDLTDPEAIDPKGVPWKAHVMKDYGVQKAAIAAGVIKKDSALPPHFALDLLRGNDPKDDNYSVMGIIVPSPRHSRGIKTLGIIRPDVVYFEDGEPHIKLWFNALMHPAYHSPHLNRAYLTMSGTPIVADFLVNAAIERMMPVAGRDVVVFSDDQCTLSIGELVGSHGFKVLLEKVAVSSLPEKRKSMFDTAANTVTLLVKPNRAYVEGMPLDKAGEMVKNYLVDGYEAPENGRLVRQALAQLKSQTARGLVLYR
ncbi:hypothetical protein HYY73_06595 [Candidatus Woesearchaeota archaeon]|nr:hypothetical protein [Candidatus Woesearchaeota archaeon]